MANFTRKHYEALAVVFNEAMEDAESEAERETIAGVVARVADTFEDDNPNFKRVRFGSRSGVMLFNDREEG